MIARQQLEPIPPAYAWRQPQLSVLMALDESRQLAHLRDLLRSMGGLTRDD